MASSKSKALVTRVTNGKASLQLEDIPTPRIEPHQLLVRVSSVAQNPTDVQCLDLNAFGDGAVLGCDFVGIVEKLGDNVKNFKIGDRIAGLIWGGYTIADEKICFKVPETVSDNDAATVPLAAGTAWLALYSKTCLNISRTQQNLTPVLVWGGSSSVGAYTIRICNIPVITVCSPKHFDFCKNLGATHVFDYHDSDVVEKIKSASGDIQHVFDCIGSESSSATAPRAVADQGGVLCTVRPGKAFTDKVESRVKITDVLVWTVFLKDHKYKTFEWPASPADHQLGAELFEAIPKLLQGGNLKTNTSKVTPGGLSGVNEGF